MSKCRRFNVLWLGLAYTDAKHFMHECTSAWMLHRTRSTHWRQRKRERFTRMQQLLCELSVISLSLSLSLSLSSGRQISGPWAIRIVNFKTRGASKTETELMKIYERASAFVKTFQWTTEERALSTLSVQRLTAYSYSCIRWKIMLIRPRFFDAPSTVDIFIKCH